MVQFTEITKTRKEKKGFSLGHVKFETNVGHSSGDEIPEKLVTDVVRQKTGIKVVVIGFLLRRIINQYSRA